MSWTIHRPNVAFRIRSVREWDARRKDPSRPIAGLSEEARALHQAKRARECRRVLPAIELNR